MEVLVEKQGLDHSCQKEENSIEIPTPARLTTIFGKINHQPVCVSIHTSCTCINNYTCIHTCLHVLLCVYVHVHQIICNTEWSMYTKPAYFSNCGLTNARRSWSSLNKAAIIKVPAKLLPRAKTKDGSFLLHLHVHVHVFPPLLWISLFGNCTE